MCQGKKLMYFEKVRFIETTMEKNTFVNVFDDRPPTEVDASSSSFPTNKK